MNSRPKTQRFDTLDGLRGVAAVAVVIRHSHALFGWVSLPNSQLAVDLFFVLSGFVLAHSYAVRLKNEMTAVAFVKARLIRLFPLYLLGLCFGALTVLAGLVVGHHGLAGNHAALSVTPSQLLWSVLFGLLMLPVPPGISNTLYPLNGPAWSLLLELIANAFYAVVARHTSGPILRALVGIALFGSALGMVATTLSGVSIDSGFEWSSFAMGLLRVCYSFTAGVLLYRFPLPSIAVHPVLALLILAAIFAIAPSGLAGTVYQLGCILLVFPALVAVASQAQPAAQLMGLFRFLGATSYAVYALHKPLEELLVGGIAALLRFDVQRIAPAGGILFIAALLAATWLIDRSYDAPIRKWLTSRLKTIRPISAVAAERL